MAVSFETGIPVNGQWLQLQEAEKKYRSPGEDIGALEEGSLFDTHHVHVNTFGYRNEAEVDKARRMNGQTTFYRSWQAVGFILREGCSGDDSERQASTAMLSLLPS
jgi:hypothetical protein